MNKIIYLLFFLILYRSTDAQQSIKNPFSYFYDNQLIKTDSSIVFSADKYYIVVSSRTCAACVQYFTSSKIKFHFLFHLNSELLFETKNVVDVYKLNGKIMQTHFYTKDVLKDSTHLIDVNMKSPALIARKKGVLYYYSYEKLSLMTSEFHLSDKSLNSVLNKL